MRTFDADKGGAGGSGNANQNGAGGSGGAGGSSSDSGGGALQYDTWLAAQPEEVRTLLDGHVRGLKTTLDGERTSRKEMEKQLKDLAGKAEKGSEAEKRLTELANGMEEADRKAGFYEQAHSAGVSNLKLAYLVAVQDDLIGKSGRVDFETMKKQYPELFGGNAKPAGNAGAGAGGGTPTGKSMNDFIRTAAGRR